MVKSEVEQALEAREGQKTYTVTLTGPEFLAIGEAMSMGRERFERYCNEGRFRVDPTDGDAEPLPFAVFLYAQRQIAHTYGEFWREAVAPRVAAQMQEREMEVVNR